MRVLRQGRQAGGCACRSHQNASNNGKARKSAAQQDTTSLDTARVKSLRKMMIEVIARIALPCCHDRSSHVYSLHSNALFTSSNCAVQCSNALPYTLLPFCTIHDMSIEASHLPYYCKIRHSYSSQLLHDSSSACITVSQQYGYLRRDPHNVTIMAKYNIHTSCSRYRHTPASTTLASR